MEAAYARFDAATLKTKIEWILALAKTTEVPRVTAMLGYELRAFARVVGVLFVWQNQERALSKGEVRRIHAMVRAGIEALQKSARAEVELRKQPGGGPAFSSSAGWRLPPHRVRLRRLPADDEVNTSTIAMYEAADEVSAIVAAIGHFLLRNSRQWRWCACGCGNTLALKGKRKFLPKHQNRHWQKQHYKPHPRGRRNRLQGAAEE